MDLTVWPAARQTWADLLDVATHVDVTGWHGVVIEDHFMADGAAFGAADDPRLEVTSVLAALAVATSSVRLAPLVMSATYRHPAVVANWASTLDHISDGRLTLGLGAGWQHNEHEQYGIELSEPGERLRRLDEYCTVVRSLLDRTETSIDGRYFKLGAARCEPKPVQPRLPLLIGGKGDRMLGLVARRADAWNTWSMPDSFAERSSVLDRWCERVDRDPGSIQRSTQALVLLTDSRAEADAFVRATAPRAAFAGTAAQFAELVARWSEEGVDEVIVPDWSMGVGAMRTDALDAIADVVRSTVGSADR
jgi:alkanesulfonate monooxygenase SsuD/methylene tetrahydromethanopterin reductase-like flavin-dependent oxidoreductase (luciferase family)